MTTFSVLCLTALFLAPALVCLDGVLALRSLP